MAPDTASRSKAGVLAALVVGVAAASSPAAQHAEGPSAPTAAPALSTRGWAVVTGASSGIGAAIAREAASRGYDVIIAARRQRLLRILADELQSDHKVAVDVVPCDLTRAGGVEKLRRAAATHNVQLLVLNAGFAYSGSFVAQPEQRTADMLALNIGSPVLLCRGLLPTLEASRGGHILIVGSSSAAAVGVPGVTVYAASKAFLRSFAAGLRGELRKGGISVTCALPGAVDTGFAASGGLERSAVFSLPGVRCFGGVVLPADVVAKRLVSAALAGRAEVVPGLLPKLYVGLTDHRLLPMAAARAVASFAFGTSPLQRLRGGSTLTLGAASVLGLAPLTLILVAINIAQNGGADTPAPQCMTLQDVRGLRRKSQFVAAWRAGSPPMSYAGRTCTGELLPLGVLAAVSAFITNVLFAPGRAWKGKAFSADGRRGANCFRDSTAGTVNIRGFGTSIAPSAYDGRDCLVLDYADPVAGDAIWGKVLGMRDEIREVAPGLYLGLGSLRASGGAQNCQPFVLVDDVHGN